jgi:hypothetical protein
MREEAAVEAASCIFCGWYETFERMLRRLVLVAAVALGVAPIAFGSSATVGAGGSVTGSGGSFTLTIRNTGTEPIKCMQLEMPPGATATGATGPAGWAAGVGAGGTRIGAQSASGIPPGGTATFTYTASGATTVASMVLHVSGDCVTDVLVSVPGPAAAPPPSAPPPPPPPPKKSCKCKKLTVKLDGTLLNKPNLRPDKHDFGVGFTWFLTCSAGNGGCLGKVQFLPPEILAGTLPKPKQNLHLNIKRATIICAGQCQQSKMGRFEIKMGSREQLNELFGRTLAYTVKTTCGATVKTIQVKVGVDQQGRLKLAK